MGPCCKKFFKVVTIILILMDIAVGWFKFYQMYKEISDSYEQNRTIFTAPDFSSCANPNIYWYLYLAFESIGTILAVIEIYCIWLEIKEDNKLHEKCFGKTFILIVMIYLASAFPSAILEILYRDWCVCNGKFSLAVWRRDVRDLAKGFLGGASVIMLQILFHITELYRILRRFCNLIAMMCWCCNYIPEDEESEQKCCEGVLPCFVISVLLAVAYVAVFVTEIVYVFCEPHHS